MMIRGLCSSYKGAQSASGGTWGLGSGLRFCGLVARPCSFRLGAGEQSLPFIFKSKEDPHIEHTTGETAKEKK